MLLVRLGDTANGGHLVVGQDLRNLWRPRGMGKFRHGMIDRR